MPTFGPISSLQSWTGRVISGNTTLAISPFRSTLDGTAISVTNDLKGYGLTPLRSYADLTDRFYGAGFNIFNQTWPGSNVATIAGEGTGPNQDVGNLLIPAARIKAEFSNSAVADAVVTVSLVRVKRFNNLGGQPLGVAQGLLAQWQPQPFGTDSEQPSSIYNPHTSFMRAPHFHRYYEVLFNHRLKMAHGCSKAIHIPLPSASVCMAVANYDSTQFADPLLPDFQSIDGVTLFVVVEAVFSPSAVQNAGSASTVANAGVVQYTLRWAEHVSYSPSTKGIQGTYYVPLAPASITPTSTTAGTSINMNQFGTAAQNLNSFVPN